MPTVEPNILYFQDGSFRFEDSNGTVLTFNEDDTYILNNILNTTHRGIGLTESAWAKVKELIFKYTNSNRDQFLEALKVIISNTDHISGTAIEKKQTTYTVSQFNSMDPKPEIVHIEDNLSQIKTLLNNSLPTNINTFSCIYSINTFSGNILKLTSTEFTNLIYLEEQKGGKGDLFSGVIEIEDYTISGTYHEVNAQLSDYRLSYKLDTLYKNNLLEGHLFINVHYDIHINDIVTCDQILEFLDKGFVPTSYTLQDSSENIISLLNAQPSEFSSQQEYIDIIYTRYWIVFRNAVQIIITDELPANMGELGLSPALVNDMIDKVTGVPSHLLNSNMSAIFLLTYIDIITNYQFFTLTIDNISISRIDFSHFKHEMGGRKWLEQNIISPEKVPIRATVTGLPAEFGQVEHEGMLYYESPYLYHIYPIKQELTFKISETIPLWAKMYIRELIRTDNNDRSWYKAWEKINIQIDDWSGYKTRGDYITIAQGLHGKVSLFDFYTIDYIPFIDIIQSEDETDTMFYNKTTELVVVKPINVSFTDIAQWEIGYSAEEYVVDGIFYINELVRKLSVYDINLTATINITYNSLFNITYNSLFNDNYTTKYILQKVFTEYPWHNPTQKYITPGFQKVPNSRDRNFTDNMAMFNLTNIMEDGIVKLVIPNSSGGRQFYIFFPYPDSTEQIITVTESPTNDTNDYNYPPALRFVFDTNNNVYVEEGAAPIGTIDFNNQYIPDGNYLFLYYYEGFYELGLEKWENGESEAVVSYTKFTEFIDYNDEKVALLNKPRYGGLDGNSNKKITFTVTPEEVGIGPINKSQLSDEDTNKIKDYLKTLTSLGDDSIILS